MLRVGQRRRLLPIEGHEVAVAPASVVVNCRRDRQPPKPAAPKVRVSERRQLAPGTNERLLRGVLGVWLVSQDRQAQSNGLA
jgi:hypothetical protein